MPDLSLLTTMVLLASSGGGGGVPGGGGCGTAASSPFGVIGVIVMKMTRSTKRISMKGVTLMSPFGPIFLPFFRDIVGPPIAAPGHRRVLLKGRPYRHLRFGWCRRPV